MNQSQQISAPLGNGAIVLTECSSDPQQPYPKLTIMLPASVEEAQAYQGVYSIHHVAQSLDLHATQVAQLYAFLKGYYESR